ncbi:response regulator [Patescibacteria group bacterium AH-259-L07]|nr:response regulator [Patescibacteria group bacterium AH-259-L07]
MEKQPKILIIDDAEFAQRTMAEALGKAGFVDILRAKNGKEGRELYNKHRPDVILLDLIMPEMNGLEFLKSVDTSKVYIIVITAVDQDAQRKEALALGAKAYITKPFKEEEIIEAVKSVAESL